MTVSDLERELVWQSNRPNFTAETLEALRARTNAQVELAFLVGADSFSGDSPAFSQWYRWEELAKTAMLVISPRQGFNLNQDFLAGLTELGGRIVYLEEIEVSDVSSSQMRTRLEEGVEPTVLAEEGYLSRKIAEYIAQHDIVSIWKQIDSNRPPVVTEIIEDTDNLETRIGKRLFEQKLTIGLAKAAPEG